MLGNSRTFAVPIAERPDSNQQSGARKTWTTIKFSDYPKVQKKKKRRSQAPLPPIRPTHQKMFPVYTPPGTPHRTPRRAKHIFKARAPYALNQTKKNDPGNSAVEPTSAESKNHIREPSFLDDLLRFSEPHEDKEERGNTKFYRDDIYNHAPEFIDAPETRIDPDYSNIEEICDRYYPHILKQHIPALNHRENCSNCDCNLGNEKPCYTCTCCFKQQWFCKECIVRNHRNNPFHRIKEWNEATFTSINVSLESLGLILNLDQLDGGSCSCAQAEKYVRDIEVVHSNGIHRIKYAFCNCNDNKKTNATASPEQLLTIGLYPATSKSPQRAFTFDMLVEYDVLNLFAFVNVKRFMDSKLYITPLQLQCSEQVSRNNCLQFDSTFVYIIISIIVEHLC